MTATYKGGCIPLLDDIQCYASNNPIPVPATFSRISDAGTEKIQATYAASRTYLKPIASILTGSKQWSVLHFQFVLDGAAGDEVVEFATTFNNAGLGLYLEMVLDNGTQGKVRLGKKNVGPARTPLATSTSQYTQGEVLAIRIESNGSTIEIWISADGSGWAKEIEYSTSDHWYQTWLVCPDDSSFTHKWWNMIQRDGTSPADRPGTSVVGDVVALVGNYTHADMTGTSTGSGATYLDDSGASWVVDEWVDWIVYSNGSWMRITSNTSTRLTGASWNGGDPGSPNAYTIQGSYGGKPSGGSEDCADYTQGDEANWDDPTSGHDTDATYNCAPGGTAAIEISTLGSVSSITREPDGLTTRSFKRANLVAKTVDTDEVLMDEDRNKITRSNVNLSGTGYFAIVQDWDTPPDGDWDDYMYSGDFNHASAEHQLSVGEQKPATNGANNACTVFYVTAISVNDDPAPVLENRRRGLAQVA